jgi:hypothetical protein
VIDTERIGRLATAEAETRKTSIEHARELRGERFSDEGQLRGEHRQLSREFIVQRNAFDRVLASAKNPSPEGDFALIFNFMKVLDPDSVVREGEFANAENAPGVPARIRTIFNRLQGNPEGTLPKEVRASFVDRSRRLFSEARKRQQDLDREFGSLAKRNQLSPRNVVIPFMQRAPAAAEREAQAAHPGSEFSHVEPGGAVVFIRPDGTAFEVRP